jgi:Na+-transporting NADH:ubiquinone oxidoreductase subunit C
MAHSTPYTIAFAAGVSIVCGVLVAGSAVALKPRQEENKTLDQRKQVLSVAGLLNQGEALAPAEINSRFDQSIVPIVIDLKSGAPAPDIAAATFDMQRAMKDPATSESAPANDAKVFRLPKHGLVYKVVEAGETKGLILPIQGYGLWSVLYGFLAVGADGNTIQGITFYQHGETPGLGGEVDNPKWKSLWPGRRAYNNAWKPAIRVIKGQAGAPDADPHSIDGLSGATITSNGVTALVQFWLGDMGYGPFLGAVREGRAI